MDRRIIKTRKTISDVFLQLLEEKAVGEITAQEIIDLAEISRSTFYQHYTDVYNLLDQAENDIFGEISDLLEGYPCEAIRADPLHLFTELFFYFRRNAKICLILINKNGSITTGQRISGMIQEKFRHEWEALLHCENELAARYLSQYIIAGFVGILQEWIAGGMQEPEEEMALLARTLISNSIWNNQNSMREELDMNNYKEKIRADARGFAGGILQDTSGLVSEKSAEIQQKVEAGLGLASSRLAQRGSGLRSGERDAAAERERQRQKLSRRKTELEGKHAEKTAKLTQEGKQDKLAEEQAKYQAEVAKLDRKLAELE